MSDLQAYEIQLRNLNGPLPLHAVRGDSLRGLFYAGFKKPGAKDNTAGAFEEQAVEAHQKGQKGRAGETAGYAVHVLGTEIEHKGQKVEIVKGIRIATFKAELGDRVAEVWGGRVAKKAQVQFGSAQMIVERINADRQNGMTFGELKQHAPAAYGLSLELKSPTVLERENHIDLLPLPKTIWAGYRRRWEQYAPGGLDLPRFDDWVEKCVHVRLMSVQTNSMLTREENELRGITGLLEFHALIEDDDFPASRINDYLQAWQMLAMFAGFCGTGKYTTEGFGHTRYVGAFGMRT